MSTLALKRIDDEVLDALASIEWNGNAAVLACGQLDRKTYERVNKVLESLGGKWNRKAKAHLFDGDAQGDLEAVIENGGYVDRKKDLGFFETPDDLADEVVALAEMQPRDIVLEPSAGTGQICRAVKRAHGDSVSLIAVEIDERHRTQLSSVPAIVTICDFLNVGPLDIASRRFHRVLNPAAVWWPSRRWDGRSARTARARSSVNSSKVTGGGSRSRKARSKRAARWCGRASWCSTRRRHERHAPMPQL